MATATAEVPTRVAFRIRANSVEACSCAHGCNCQFGGFPNEGICEFVIGYDILEGNFGDVDMAGVKAAVIAKYPNAIHEGNGHVVLLIDQQATGDQVNALASIISGQHGGMPWEALAGTISRFEGPISAPIEIRNEGRRSSVRIPNVIELEMEPLLNPVTGAEQDVHITYPSGGFFWNDAEVGTTSTMRAEHGDLRMEWAGKYASVAEVNWTNQA